MNDDLHNLQAWSTQRTVQRANIAQREFAATPWADGAGDLDNAPELSQTTLVHGAHVIVDEWAVLQQQRFLQNPDDRTLRLAPIVIYPGIVLAPWVESGPPTPANKALWIVAKYRLEPARYPGTTPEDEATFGWSGGILGTEAVFEWGERDSRENQIFPGLYTNSMPPGNVFVWNFRIGVTDAAGNFTLSGGNLISTCGQYIPPF